MVDFIFVMVNFFHCLLRLRRYERKSIEVSIFQRGVTFSEYLTGYGASPINHSWCQKTRVIAVSCGIKISTMHHLVLSQLTIHASDGQTDGQTDRIMAAISCIVLHAAW